MLQSLYTPIIRYYPTRGAAIKEALQTKKADPVPNEPEASIEDMQSILVELQNTIAPKLLLNDVAPIKRDELEIVSPEDNSPTVFSSPYEFVSYFMPKYEKVLKEEGLSKGFAKYLVGQIALESGWGKKPVGWQEGKVSNNYMGEKWVQGSGKDNFMEITTHEYVNGKKVEVKDKFRTFNSIDDMVEFHVKKFLGARWRKHNIYDPKNIEGFATRVKNAGYATDINYIVKLNSTAKTVDRIFKSSPKSATAVAAGKSLAGAHRRDRNPRNIPTNIVNGINVGHMISVIKVLDNHNIKYRLTSGMRTKPMGTSGKNSWHLDGRAIDIVAPQGMAPEQFLKQFVGNTSLLNAIRDLNYGILNEYNAKNLKKTGGTGAHLHIGPDHSALAGIKAFYNPNMSLFK